MTDTIQPTEGPGSRAVDGVRPLLLPMAATALGIWILILTPVILILPQRAAVIAPDSKSTVLSIVLGLGAAASIVCNPLVGWLSDRTTSRWGRRRPWLLGLAIAAATGLVIAATAQHTVVLTLGWCLTAGSANGLLAVLFALIPEHIPAQQRGAVSGMLGVAQALAAVLGLMIVRAAPEPIGPVILAAGSVAACLWLLFTLPDEAVTHAPAKVGLRQVITSYWVDPRRHPDFAWLWLNRFLIFTALTLVLNYQLYFLTEQLGLPEPQATALIQTATIINTLAVCAASFAAGRLSDRIGRRRPVVLAAALIAATGLFLMAMTSHPNGYLVAMAVVGIGTGVYCAVDLALATQVLPDAANAGKDLGVFNLATQLPQSMAPAIAPMILALGPGHNYTALYLTGAAFAAVGAVTINKVRGVR